MIGEVWLRRREHRNPERLIADQAAYLRVEAADLRQTGADLALVDAVRDYLREHPESNNSAVQRALGKQKDRVKSALDMLRAKGEAVCRTSGKAMLWKLK